MLRLISILFTTIIFMSCTEPQIALKFFNAEGPGVKMFAKNNERDFSYDVEIGDSLSLLWQNKTTGSYSNYSPIVFGNYLLVQDLSGVLSSFNKNDGLKLGENTFNGEIATTPILRSFKIFFTLNYLRENYFVLYSYDLVRSKILSETELPGSCQNEMVLTKDFLFILSDNGTLYKFNDVGFKLDMIETNALTQSDLSADDENLYWANQTGEIISVKQNDLSENYRIKISNAFEAGLTLKNGYGYLGDTRGFLYKIKLADGSLEWEFDTGNRIKCNPALKDDMVYIGNLAGSLFAINNTNGSVLFEVETGGILNTTPLAFNDVLIQQDLNEKVYMIRRDNGDLLQEIPFERRVKMTPIYHDGIIYFGADRGQIYAYKPVRNSR